MQLLMNVYMHGCLFLKDAQENYATTSQIDIKDPMRLKPVCYVNYQKRAQFHEENIHCTIHFDAKSTP